MGKYSINGSPVFDAAVDRHMQRIADEVWTSSYSRHWKALVLLGSYGRGEGPLLVGKDGTEHPYGDYNLAVVTTKVNPLIRGALNHLEKRLTAELDLPVTLYPYLKKTLGKCEFSLLNYEMKYGHKVIRGDEQILARMPNYPHDQIPLSEGTRLLMNRGKLLLDIKRRLATKELLTPEEKHRFIRFILKTNLALGDCALLMRNAGDISYAVKKQRIKDLDLQGLNDPRGVVNDYLYAIGLREQGNFKPVETVNIHMWLDEAIQHFRDVFLWYERRGLNRKFRDVKKYSRTFPRLGNEGSPLRNAAYNLATFGLRAFPHLLIHPRIRLYPAILLLLDDHADLEEIRRLLKFPDGNFEELCNYFVRLQQEFS